MLVDQEIYYQKIKRLNIDHYSRETSYYSRAPLRLVEKNLLKKLPPKSNILDLGCGSGRFSVNAALMDFKITGVDITSSAIKCAKKKASDERLSSIEFIIGDMTNLSFKDNSFDFVFCPRFSINAIATLNKRKLAIKEMLRVVKPGGQVFVESFNKLYLGGGIILPFKNLLIDIRRYLNIFECFFLGKEYYGLLPGDLIYKANKVTNAPQGYTHLPTIIEILRWLPKVKSKKIQSIYQIVNNKNVDIFKFFRYSIWIILEK